jgi:rubrerythrin
MSTANLLEAIRVVRENERRATESYADAANRIPDPMGKALFENLSAFEHYHFERLSALVKSLEEKGEYINYDGKEFPLPPLF